LSKKTKIGIIRLSALGDVTLIVPLVELLTRSSNTNLTWITTQATVDLLGPIEGCRYLIIEKPRSIASLYRLWKKLRNELFDTLIVAQASFSSHLVSLMTSAKCKVGFDQNRGKDLHSFFVSKSISFKNEHFVDAYLSFAGLVGVKAKISRPEMWKLSFTHLSPEWSNKFRVTGKALVAINPHPSNEERRWTQEGYKLLIKALLKSNCRVLVLGGHDSTEKDLNHEMLEGIEGDIINLTDRLSLNQWASILKGVDLLIAPDTGAIHVANALSTEVVGLYAIANPKLTGPYDSLDNCINRFPEAVRKFSKQKEFDYHKRVHDNRAMELISFEDVWGKVSSILGIT